jgi:hypothetical protein
LRIEALRVAILTFIDAFDRESTAKELENFANNFPGKDDRIFCS